jgi:hypothetical protein
MGHLCAMCQMRDIYGEGVDKTKPTLKYQNPVDKLTSTVSWPALWSKYCYFCRKKHNGLIRLN